VSESDRTISLPYRGFSDRLSGQSFAPCLNTYEWPFKYTSGVMLLSAMEAYFGPHLPTSKPSFSLDLL
jgi:hypothetical protein